jgi:hypothetical protein
MKKSHSIAAVVMTTAALIVSMASTARADPSPASWFNQATSRCLDDSTAYGQDVLRGYVCNGGAYQHWRWTLVFSGGGVSNEEIVTLRNVGTGRCLDDSTSNGKDLLRGYPCNGGLYQEWYEMDNGSGYVALENVTTGRCLDDSTAFGQDVLRGYDQCNWLPYQGWYATSVF